MDLKDLPKILFNDKKRREFMSPERVIDQISIKKGMIIADLGCGSGFFTIPIAEAVETEGKVFAVDILKRMIQSVKSQAKEKGFDNIETIIADIEVLGDTKIEDGSIDLVLLSNVFFQSQKRKEIVEEIKRILKSESTLVVIEWKPETPFGPEVQFRLSKEKTISLVCSLGFNLEKEIDVGSYHYGLVFKKK